MFVLPVFELEENVVPPKYKEELLILLRKKKAHIFHEEDCRPCHEVPKYDVGFIYSFNKLICRRFLYLLDFDRSLIL